MPSLSTLRIRSKLDFPTELLLIIKELLDPFDLRTHVCYYLSSPRVAALYDSADDPDAFWKLACWNCGIGAGLTQDEDDIDENRWHYLAGVSWKNIALDSIVRDGFCKHPCCGEALLEYNRECMRDLADEIVPFRPYNLSDYKDHMAISGHRLFGNIEFKRGRPLYASEGTSIEYDAHLRAHGAPVRRIANPDYKSQPDDYPGLYLGEHPLAARSFATWAPVSKILLLPLFGHWLDNNGRIKLSRPVIVLDVLKAVHKHLDRHLDVDEICEHMELHGYCIPAEWPHAEAFRVARTMRSMLSVCPIQRLEFEEIDGHRIVVSLDLK
ncbi:hypothetical protein C8Q73DRAFT_521387 [Cubamyces lactineus]|nr:hypothetical protein C8Q73DRAFT_521387 [Cubamyces lactineus]